MLCTSRQINLPARLPSFPNLARKAFRRQQTCNRCQLESKSRHTMDLVKKNTIRVACLVTPAIWYNWSTFQILGVFCLPSGSLSEAMFTENRIAFTPAQKPFRIVLLFTHTNGDFDAISVTERGCAARIS